MAEDLFVEWFDSHGELSGRAVKGFRSVELKNRRVRNSLGIRRTNITLIWAAMVIKSIDQASTLA